MGLLQKVKSLLGLGEDRRRQSQDRTRGNTEVTVERQPATGSENAVKGTDAGADAGTAAESAASGGTDASDTAAPSADADETAEDDVSADAEMTADAEVTADDDDAGDADGTAAEADASGSDADDAEAADSPPVQDLEGIGAAYSDRLGEASVETVADLAAADAATLSEETGISEKRLRRWIDAAQDY